MTQFLELGGNSYVSGYGVRTQVRSRFVHLIVFVLLAVALSRLFAHVPLPSAPAVTFIPAATKTVQTVAKPALIPAKPPTIASSAVTTSAAKSCAPAQYSLPAKIDLSSAQTGLTQVMDARQYYKVYGTSTSQIRQQITACAPHVNAVTGTYAAYTSYTISWQYDYADNGAGVCTVENAKIGLRQNQIFPQWESAGGAVLQQQWQSFMSGLEIHEQGQVALNEQYAQTMLNQLQNFPPTPCSAINGVVNTQMNSTIAALNAAHQSYEDATNYGATQGAIVP